MRRGWLVLGVLVLLLGGLAAGGAYLRHGLQSFDQPIALAAPVRFEVPAGARLSQVSAQLAARGALRHPRLWVLYARWRGMAGRIKAGEYEIEPNITPRALLEKLVSGQVLLHAFTIVDGWRVEDLLTALRHNPDVVATLPAGSADHLNQVLGLEGRSAEGEFLPETYRFPKGTRDIELLRTAHAALTRTLEAEWAAREPTIPLHDARELLIMASIIEKESGLPQELPRIAGLYLNRLSIGMRLQADPTVIYGLGDRYQGELHTVDLRTDGPYNTYTRVGLPPTPIALPGAAALHATAHPEKTDALYFVASGKSDGSHVFSSTLEQQNLAVAQYLVRQRQKAAANAH